MSLFQDPAQCPVLWHARSPLQSPAQESYATMGAPHPSFLSECADAAIFPTVRSRAMDKLFISANSLLRDSMELARLIVSSGFRPTFLAAMWRGGAPIGIAIQEVLEYHSIYADHIAIRTSSYTGIDTQNKTVRVHAVDYLVSHISADDELLLDDDVFDSGRSLEAVVQELKQRCRA